MQDMDAIGVVADEELASATTSMRDDAHYDADLLNNGLPWA